jgi:DNA-binding transcriptional LysR family regulator
MHRLNITQPPLSMQIRAMEEEIGTPLFERTRRRVELTEAGRVLLEQARASLAQLERAAELARRAGRGEAGELRVAFTGSVPLVDAFACIVCDFRERFPLARLELTHQSTGHQLQALLARRLDVGLLRPSHLFEPPPQLAVREIWRDELRVVLPARHRLARDGAAIAVEDLAQEPFLMFPRGLGCGLHDHVMGLCSRAGFAPHVAQEAREGVTLIGLVAAGMGIAVLPDSYARAPIGGVVHLPLASAHASSRLLLAHAARDASPLVQRFVELAAEHVRTSTGKPRGRAVRA